MEWEGILIGYILVLITLVYIHKSFNSDIQVVDAYKIQKNNWCGKFCSLMLELWNSCFYKIENCSLQLTVINFVEEKYVPFTVQSEARLE